MLIDTNNEKRIIKVREQVRVPQTDYMMCIILEYLEQDLIAPVHNKLADYSYSLKVYSLGGYQRVSMLRASVSERLCL